MKTNILIDPVINKMPTTLDEVVEVLYQDSDQYRKKHNITAANIEEEMPHHGYGTVVRNELHLWWQPDWPKKHKIEKPAIVQWFNDRNIFHADDMSGTIQEALKAKLAGEPFNVDEHLKVYFDHWRKEGFKDGIFKTE